MYFKSMDFKSKSKCFHPNTTLDKTGNLDR